MAMNLRGLCRLNIGLANSVLFKYNFINVGFIRCLYAERDLGITMYENARFLFRNQFMTIEDTFRTKMKEICEDENGVIYTEDLKAMLHLARETDDDMQLLSNMLVKYAKSKDERRFSSYAFSPVVMRMYYYLNQPQQALNVFNDPIFAENFHYRSSFRILMCLLFKNNMYKEMRDTFEKTCNSKGMNFIGSSSVLMYAGCLKENTPEALEFALKHWKEQYLTARPALRSCALISLLAIKNNAAETAVEILSVVDRQGSITVRCLKLVAYMHLQRYMQIIPMLRHAVENRDNSVFKEQFFADVIYELEEKLTTADTNERDDLLHLVGEVKKLGLIDTHSTLEEFLLRPMVIKNLRTNQKSGKYFTKNQSMQKPARIGLKNYL